jgi:hypothetical protein
MEHHNQEQWQIKNVSNNKYKNYKLIYIIYIAMRFTNLGRVSAAVHDNNL